MTLFQSHLAFPTQNLLFQLPLTLEENSLCAVKKGQIMLLCASYFTLHWKSISVPFFLKLLLGNEDRGYIPPWGKWNWMLPLPEPTTLSSQNRSSIVQHLGERLSSPRLDSTAQRWSVSRLSFLTSHQLPLSARLFLFPARPLEWTSSTFHWPFWPNYLHPPHQYFLGLSVKSFSSGLALSTPDSLLCPITTSF